MYYPSELQKVNSFHQVRIPSNAEYFARYGYAVSPESQYSGDNPSPQSMDKLQMMRTVEKSLVDDMNKQPKND